MLQRRLERPGRPRPGGGNDGAPPLRVRGGARPTAARPGDLRGRSRAARERGVRLRASRTARDHCGRRRRRHPAPRRSEKTPWRVRFREPSPWNRHRWSIAIVFAVLVVQSALIAGLLVQRRARRRAEASARENLAVVAHLEPRRRRRRAGGVARPRAQQSARGGAQQRTGGPPNGPARRGRTWTECLDDIIQDAQRAGEVIRRMRGALAGEPDLAGRRRGMVVRDAVRC